MLNNVDQIFEREKELKYILKNLNCILINRLIILKNNF